MCLKSYPQIFYKGYLLGLDLKSLLCIALMGHAGCMGGIPIHIYLVTIKLLLQGVNHTHAAPLPCL